MLPDADDFPSPAADLAGDAAVAGRGGVNREQGYAQEGEGTYGAAPLIPAATMLAAGFRSSQGHAETI